VIRSVKRYPELPTPYSMRDWRWVAERYDELVFDFERRDDFFPVIWWDESDGRGPSHAFGLPSYVGGIRTGDRHEAINCVAAVLGATLCGRDKRTDRGQNWVQLCLSYYDEGQHLFLNRRKIRAGSSFWYEIYPHILLYSLVDCYPEESRLGEIMEVTAREWQKACEALKGTDGVPDFNHVSFDFSTLKPVDNGRWREPDAAAGVAWLEYMAYMKFGDPIFLQAALDALRFLEHAHENPFYENLLPFGAFVAARVNAELGETFAVERFVNWCFDGDSTARPGWGVIDSRWGDMDCHGLQGSLTDWGQRWDRLSANASHDALPSSADGANESGYAFTTNTFCIAGALLPLVRYDPSFAPDIARWLLHLANNARLFYPNALPAKQQSCAFFRSDEDAVIAYEGLRRKWDYQSPYATGDPIRYSWGSIDLGLYGSSHVGILGGVLNQSEVDGVVYWDCLKTDYFHQPAFPTYLVYNPHFESVKVGLPMSGLGQNCTVDVYDKLTHRWLATGSHPDAKLDLGPLQVAVLVICPVGSELEGSRGKLMANGVTIDFHYPEG